MRDYKYLLCIIKIYSGFLKSESISADASILHFLNIYFSFVEPSVRVHPFVCGRTLGTDKQILAQLKGVRESDLWDCQLILAFSPVTSRAGTDAEEALKKIPGNYYKNNA